MQPDLRSPSSVSPSAAESLTAVSSGRDRMDPELRAVLEDPTTSFLSMFLSAKTLPEKRKAMDELCAVLLDRAPNDRVKTEDRMIPGPPGAPDVRVRIYRPADQAGLVSGLCWMHARGDDHGQPGAL